MADVEVAQLKKYMNNWKEIVILADSLLTWEKDLYPIAVGAANTLVFIIVWYLEPSVITLLSSLALIATALDYGVPKIMPKLYQASWSPEKEVKLDRCCRDLVQIKSIFANLARALASLKKEHEFIFFVGTIIVLYFIACLGSILSGLTILYIGVLMILMLPALHRKGLLLNSIVYISKQIEEHSMRSKED